MNSTKPAVVKVYAPQILLQSLLNPKNCVNASMSNPGDDVLYMVVNKLVEIPAESYIHVAANDSGLMEPAVSL
jgi:hypothetical protein